jgi:hypothetical protein
METLDPTIRRREGQVDSRFRIARTTIRKLQDTLNQGPVEIVTAMNIMPFNPNKRFMPIIVARIAGDLYGLSMLAGPYEGSKLLHVVKLNRFQLATIKALSSIVKTLPKSPCKKTTGTQWEKIKGDFTLLSLNFHRLCVYSIFSHSQSRLFFATDGEGPKDQIRYSCRFGKESCQIRNIPREKFPDPELLRATDRLMTSIPNVLKRAKKSEG